MGESRDALAQLLHGIANQAIDNASEDLHGISQEIWKNPELCFAEHFAHKALTDFLEERGFTTLRNYVYDTGFRAHFGDDQSPRIALMAEYDALPEIGHACGHNLIAESALGAAIGIKAALEELQKKQGSKGIGQVVVLGTPAEEGGGGKCGMIKQGALEGIDCALMSHPAPHSNLSFFAGTGVNVTFHGKPSHAAAAPSEGVNALDAAVMVYNGISCLRQQLKPNHSVQIIIRKGGTAVNVIPEESEIEVAIRAPTRTELIKVLKPKVEACFKSAALATGCQCTIQWKSITYENVINSSLLMKLYDKHCAALGVEVICGKHSMAGTDMGNVSHVMPSIHPAYSLGLPNVFNHTRPFAALAGSPEAQQYVIKQCKVLANLAIDVLLHPEWVSQMKKELEEDLAKEEESA